MRRYLPALIAVPLALAGCSESGSGDGPSSEGGPLAAVEVVEPEQDGEAPGLELGEEPLSVAEPTSRVVTEGDGEAVDDGDLVGIQYVAVNGEDGSSLGTSDWAGGPQYFTAGSDQTPIGGPLSGTAVGSRLVTAIPPAEGAPAGAPGAQSTVVVLIDVVSIVPPRAGGAAVAPVEGLPQVALEESGAPTITIPEGAEPPAELVAQQLITGEGPEVESGQTITVQYTGVNWTSGETFDSSWERGEPATFPIGVGQVIPGWDAGLVGQPVGSQVLLVIPPAQGYGEAGQPDAGIGAEDTLVFVVDILAAA